MPGACQTLPSGIQGGGSPAAAVVSPNLRVRTASGFVGTLADLVVLSAPPVAVAGFWTVPEQRTFVGFIPAISVTSTGITVNGVGTSTGPMTVTAPDTRAKST